MRKEFFFFPGLTSSVFPDEIEKMDPADMHLYKKMLDSGKVKTYNIRLMFVGLYGAGKTSTARRIMGKDIDGVTSTDGIDVYTDRCRIDIRNKKWRNVEGPRDSFSIEQLRTLHFADVWSQSQVPDIKTLENTEKQSYDESSKNEGTAMETDERTATSPAPLTERRRSSKRSWSDYTDDNDDSSSLASSQSSVSRHFSRLGVRSLSSSFSSTASDSDFEMIEDETTQSVSESRKRARHVLEMKASHNEGIQYQEASVSLWDFAGQFVYYSTHQLFFSPRCIYLLVLNMEDDLEKTLKDWYMDIRGRESIESKGGINFWMRSILTYAKGSSSGIPPIILVGTHSDRLKGSSEKKQKLAKAYFSKIRSFFQGSSLLNNIRHEFFLLDNTKQDVEIDRLKETILSVAQTMPYWGEYTPAKWLELEQALDDIRDQRRPYMKLTQLRNINEELASPIEGEEQLQLFLKAHHEIGNIIFFGDSEKLRDVVILEPQWIINAFKTLIGATDFGKKYGNLRSEWEQFNETGRLTAKLAKQIWELDEENRFLENSEMLLDFLEKLDIIARASVLSEDKNTVKGLDFYFVPCMLKESPPKNLLLRENRPDAFSTPVLCLDFCDGFMPPAIFYRVVALCIGKWPIARNGKKILMFCGCAVFEVNFGKGQNLHRLYIFSRKSKIGLRITRYSSKTLGMVDPNICDKVRRFVTSAVKREFTRFHITQNEPEKKHFSYRIQCKETDENDILDEGLHTDADLLKAINTDFFCAEHSDRDDPHSLKPVGMLHEWFYGKVPQSFRLEGGNVFDTWIERLPDGIKAARVTENTLSKLTVAIGNDWRKLMKVLEVKETDLDIIEMNYVDSKRLQKFYGLRKWRSQCDTKTDKNDANETMRDKISASASNELLLKAIKRAGENGLDIDFEEVQNVFDDLPNS